MIKIRSASNGGVAIECGSEEVSSNLKASAENKLGETYEISALEKHQPSVKVIGIDIDK